MKSSSLILSGNEILFITEMIIKFALQHLLQHWREHILEHVLDVFDALGIKLINEL